MIGKKIDKPGLLDITFGDPEIFFQRQEVPEPITILGTSIALGFGAVFKRKNTLNNKS